MPIDFSRIIQAATEAALESQSPAEPTTGKAKKKGFTTPRALMMGAGAFTVGRLLIGSRGREIIEDLQQRLAAYESEHFGDAAQDADEDLDDEEEFADEPEGEYDEDEEEPEDEYDEDQEPEGEYDEDEEEPQGEYDEDEEPEGEFEEDQDEDEEPEAERPIRRRGSPAGSRNGRH